MQRALSAHDGTSVVYPKAGLWADGSHHNLVLNFYGDYTRPEVVREDIFELFERIGAEARASERDLVISSEVLGGRQKPGLFIEALLAHLGANIRVEIIAVARDHFERASSVYNQRVKDVATSERRDPDTFLKEHATGLTYEEMLERLLRTKFDLRVLNYHPAGDFVSRLLTHVGFAQGRIHAAESRNVSLSTKALIATLAANRVGLNADERRIFDAALRTMPGSFAPSRFIFGPEAARKAEIVFSRDRAFLEDNFGIEFPAADVPDGNSGFRIARDELDDIVAAIDVVPRAGEIYQCVARYLSAGDKESGR